MQSTQSYKIIAVRYVMREFIWASVICVDLCNLCTSLLISLKQKQRKFNISVIDSKVHTEDKISSTITQSCLCIIRTAWSKWVKFKKYEWLALREHRSLTRWQITPILPDSRFGEWARWSRSAHSPPKCNQLFLAADLSWKFHQNMLII